jgi:hypothetical protein
VCSSIKAEASIESCADGLGAVASCQDVGDEDVPADEPSCLFRDSPCNAFRFCLPSETRHASDRPTFTIVFLTGSKAFEKEQPPWKLIHLILELCPYILFGTYD